MKIELDCTEQQLEALNNDEALIYDDVDDMPPVVLITKKMFLKMLKIYKQKPSGPYSIINKKSVKMN